MKIKVGTRKSALALAQTELVINEIKKVHKDIEFEVIKMSTKGDDILDKPLLEFGGKGAFITEFEKAIANGTIDMAVHSGKDLPAILEEGLEVVANPKREDPRDVILFPLGVEFNENTNYIIGTGSLRREDQVCRLHKNIKCKPIRGNVHTRISKMEKGEYDGLMLAYAGLKRLGISENDFNIIPLGEEQCIPAATQGIIAVECKKDSPFKKYIQAISHEETELSFNAERKVLDVLGADCHESIGIFSQIINDQIIMTGFLGKSDVKTSQGNISNWENVAIKLAGELK